MASNKELSAQIAAINPDAVTDGLNNAQLAAMLKDLRSDSVDATSSPSGADVFKVAPGKAITSLRGILPEGETVEPSDFHGGVEAFAVLCEKGHIVK